MKSLSLVLLFLFLSLGAAAQRTAVLGALDQEIAILLDSLKDKKEEQFGGLTFYTGNLKGQAVVIAKSGVGKVNAAYSTAILLDRSILLVLRFPPSANFRAGDTMTSTSIPIRPWSSKLKQLPKRSHLFQFPIGHRVYSQV